MPEDWSFPLGNERDHLARQAAISYYVENLTMETIRVRMGISRSTVSRLLAYAREQGIVTISVAPPQKVFSRLETSFRERFPINLHIVPVVKAQTQNLVLETVGKVAAQYLHQIVKSEDTIGFAWGNTTSEVVQHLPRKELDGITLVQLNGAASTVTSGISHVGQILFQAAQKWDAQVVQFPVPAFFDNPATKEAMWEEGAVKRVLDWHDKCTIAVFGVGALRADLPSHVYSAGYLSQKELGRLEYDGVVGDVCTVLLRLDGSWKDIEINHRATGPSPDRLRQVPRRVCVAAGRAKAPSLVAALNAGVITDLICDQELAEAAWAILQKVPTSDPILGSIAPKMER